MSELTKAGVEFYKEHAKLTDEKKRVWSVNASDYKKFFKKHGISEDIAKKVREIESAVINGGNKFLTEKMVEEVKTAKKSGDDPKQIKITLKTATPDGRNVQTMDSFRQYHNPKNPGQMIGAYAPITLRVYKNRLVDSKGLDDAIKAVETAVLK